MSIFGTGLLGLLPTNKIMRKYARKGRKEFERAIEKVSPKLGDKIKKANKGINKIEDMIYLDESAVKKLRYGISEDIKPANGSLVYCELGPVEHSGIYIGNGRFIDLDGKGQIKKVSLEEFTANVATIDTGIWFPFDKELGAPARVRGTLTRAKQMLGDSRNYKFVRDNCHQFSSGCITGNFENADNFLTFLKHTFEKEYGRDVIWLKWNWE